MIVVIVLLGYVAGIVLGQRLCVAHGQCSREPRLLAWPLFAALILAGLPVFALLVIICVVVDIGRHTAQRAASR